MKHLSEKELKDLLTPSQRPVPPAGLLERIKQDIPADLPVADRPAGDVTPMWRKRQAWLMAASVLLTVGGGFIALRLMEQMPTPSETTAVVSDASDGLTRSPASDASEGVTRSPASGSESFDPSEPSDKSDRSDPSDGSGTTEGQSNAPMGGDVLSRSERAEIAEPTAAPEATAPRTATPAPAPDPAPTVTRGSLGNEGAPRSQEAAGADRDGVAAQLARPPEKAKKPLDDTPRQSRRAEGEEPARSELSRRLDEQTTQPAPPPPPPARPMARRPAPTRPAAPVPPPAPPAPNESRLFDNVDAESKSAPAGRSSASAGTAAPAEPPRARLREKKKVDTYVGRSHENLSIESSNAQIAVLAEEARQLEAELKALEQGRSTPTPPSTGGTAEPNDAPYGDTFFNSADTNPFIDTEDDALSTFGLDVDTGSYTVARRYLSDGHLPPPEAVRVEEFINFFDYGDAAPKNQEFAIHAEGAPSIYGQGERYHLLRFNLSGRELEQAERRPALLTFVIDVSGSMGRENRLGLVKQALALLIDQLRSDDRLALVIYGSRGQVVLQPTSDHGAIRRAIDQLRTGGSTNAEEGLTLAYQLAASHRRRSAINRVILCSDGVANVGATSSGSILERIRREADQGIELTTVGFGMGNYNDVLMEQLADNGNGRYAYVDTLAEARRIFVENLTGTLQTLAAEARVQVDFDPSVVARYRLLGYENRDIADHRFRDDSVDAGEIGVGHKVTALYEIKTRRGLKSSDPVATLHLRYGSVDRGEMVEFERTVTGADFAPRWQNASRALKLTSLVAEYAEILKRTYWAREGDLEDVFRRAQVLSAQWQGDRDVADFVSLVGRAAEYRRQLDRQRQDRQQQDR